MSTQLLSTLFAILSLAVLTSCFLLWGMKAAALITRKPSNALADLRRFAPDLISLVAGTAMLGSLYYSEIVGYVPCVLCWYQRIAIYGIAIISIVALIKKHSEHFRTYVLTFALLGLPISIYHTWLQANPRVTSFCTLEAPCSERHVWEFGFVSIPFMAFTVLFFTATLILTTRSKSEPNQ